MAKEKRVPKKSKEERQSTLRAAQVKDEERSHRRKLELAAILLERRWYVRLAKLVLFLCLFPWKWAWKELGDWRSIVIFAIVALLLSSEGWVPGLIWVFTMHDPNLQALSKSMNAFMISVILFWNGPGTPFLALCIVITAAVKEILNRTRFHSIRPKKEKFAKRKPTRGEEEKKQ